MVGNDQPGGPEGQHKTMATPGDGDTEGQNMRRSDDELKTDVKPVNRQPGKARTAGADDTEGQAFHDVADDPEA